MKKELGIKPYLFPMPVLMIATYGSDGAVDVMNMAWGGVCASNMVALNIDEDHKTTQNIKERMAFTLSVADIDHLEESDFFGIASGNKMEDKFERTGMHAVRSDKVDAPVIEEYPLTLECKVVYKQEQDPDQISEKRKKIFYPEDVDGSFYGANRDYHTAYYGQILNAYILED